MSVLADMRTSIGNAAFGDVSVHAARFRTTFEVGDLLASVLGRFAIQLPVCLYDLPERFCNVRRNVDGARVVGGRTTCGTKPHVEGLDDIVSAVTAAAPLSIPPTMRHP
jgi:hypothetical protein